MKKREYSDRFPHSAVKDIVLRLARERDLPDEELSFLIESDEAGIFSGGGSGPDPAAGLWHRCIYPGFDRIYELLQK